MTAQHAHAEILRAIADGKVIQWLHIDHGILVDQEPETTLDEISMGEYSPERYRVKPDVIVVNGIEVPGPARSPLARGEQYWLADSTNIRSRAFIWVGDDCDARWLELGLIHLSKESAQAHVDAMLLPSRIAIGGGK